MYYVIQVMSGREKEIIDLIKKKISNDIVLDCFTPIRKRLKKFAGKWKEVEERFFPGYIFVETNEPEKLFLGLKQIPKFTKLLGKQKDSYYFCHLTKEEGKNIDFLTDKETKRISEISSIELQEGKKVKIISGPLVGFEGNIVKIDFHRKTVKVLINMFGKKCEVLLGISIISEEK